MRSLLLAGGGLKVAFQAGVLQVWLSEVDDEDERHFDHVDACSGGAFNLALLCSGRSGIEIADLWRRFRPLDGVSFSLGGLLRGESLVTMQGYRDTVFPSWELDWDHINHHSPYDATFTVHERTTGKRKVFTAEEMDEDRLVATLSQALWFPPVPIGEHVYTDAVFDTDANVDVAVRKGADEIRVIWTVSTRPEWMPGVLAQFFHALEVSANGTLQSDLDRIRFNNRGPTLFEKPVEAQVLRAEVGTHYLALFNGDRLHRAVEQGVRAARSWCDERGIRYTPIDRSDFYDTGVELHFSDRLSGRLRGRRADAELFLTVPDSGEFVNAGRQRVQVSGSVTCSVLEGRAAVEKGWADILLDAEGHWRTTDVGGVCESDYGVDPTRKHMLYVLHLLTPDTRRRVTFVGTKALTTPTISGVAREATTMAVRILDGWVDSDDGRAPLWTGLLWMGPLDVARQLVGARASGPDLASELGGLARYGALFAGSLWDVAARKVLTYAPF